MSIQVPLRAGTILKKRALAHDEDDDRCWCRPELMKLCPEACCGIHGCPDSCWRCAGKSLVPAEGDECEPLIVLHRDL